MSSTENFSKNPEVIMNRKSLGLVTIVLLSLITLLGCSPDDDAATGSPLITGPLAELQGTWARNCYSQSNVIKSNDNYRIIETYKISGTNASVKKMYHASNDVDCTQSPKFMDESSYNNLAVGDNGTSPGNFRDYQLTYSVQSYGRTPLDISTTSDWQNNFRCSIFTWATDNYTNLLGNDSCGKLEKVTLLNAYRIVGTNLYLGDPLDKAEFDNYPPVDDQIPYIKQ